MRNRSVNRSRKACLSPLSNSIRSSRLISGLFLRALLPLGMRDDRCAGYAASFVHIQTLPIGWPPVTCFDQTFAMISLTSPSVHRIMYARLCVPLPLRLLWGSDKRVHRFARTSHALSESHQRTASRLHRHSRRGAAGQLLELSSDRMGQLSTKIRERASGNVLVLRGQVCSATTTWVQVSQEGLRDLRCGEKFVACGDAIDVKNPEVYEGR